MATRIGIIGAGAIGSVVGGMLTRAGHDVTLIDQWPDHIEAIKRHGLRLSGTCGEHLVPVKAMHIHETQGLRDPFDVIFISVKSYDTEWATALATVYLRQPSGIVVDFQNGINDERVAAVAGRERTLGCVITISAGMYEPGHAIRTDTGSIGFKIGEHDGKDTPRAQEIAVQGKSYQIPSAKGATIPPEAPKLSEIKLIDFDFARYGSSSERRRLLSKWDNEVKNLPK